MQNIWYAASHILGIVIVHSLWQGLIIYSLIRLYLLCAPAAGSAIRYRLCMAALSALILWFAFTLSSQIQQYSIHLKNSFLPVHIHDLFPLYSAAQTLQAAGRYEFDLNGYMPYLTAIYIAGFIINGLRLVYAWYATQQLKHSAIPALSFQNQLNTLAKQLNVSRRVKAMFSPLVHIPCVIGHLKPLLLLPVTLSTSLSAEEVETIMLHELAHIRRNDFAWNLLQQLITLLLFFNPFVHLLSRELDAERENHCDDLVVDATSQPLCYAQALYKLEAQRQLLQQPTLAMAATGNKYYLLNRIQRIMKPQQQQLNLKPTLMAMVLLATGTGLITLLQPQIAQGKISIRNIKPVIETLLTTVSTKPDTIPGKNTNGVPKKPAPVRANRKGPMPPNSNKAVEEIFDPKMQSLMAELQQRSSAMSRYYSSEDFVKAQKKLADNSTQMESLYSEKQLSRLTDELSKAGSEFGQQWGNNSKLQELSSQMGAAGAKIGAYYSSTEFKKMDNELRKKYGLPLDYKIRYDNSDPKYRAYQDELKSKIPAEVQQQQEKMKNLGEDMKKVYEDPEYKVAQKRLQLLSDSVSRAYSNPKMKELQNRMKQYGDQMSKWQNNPEFKRQQALVKETGDKIRAYTQSPEYKKHMKAWSENMKNNMAKSFDQMQFNFDWQQKNLDKIQKDFDQIEKPEQPEKPELKEPSENQ